MEKYIAIDLKSFYASVECVERGLDPLRTNLLVADPERTEKTICLAVSPSLKGFGVPSRPRLFEAIASLKVANEKRRRISPTGRLSGSSYSLTELEENPNLAIGYITATPRMAHYIEYSRRIYSIYLRYVAPEDIHVYSVDEVFIYASPYMKLFKMSAYELARTLIRDVLRETGITATAGIGDNMYLCKVAMDIVAKRTKPDRDGVRIAELTEQSYREKLWDHKPLTDFWRVGHGYAKKLEAHGLYTMGDVARCSIGSPSEVYNEDLLYRLFGVNAELLIDHAWGYESCAISDVKAYKPRSKSMSTGQVLQCPYEYAKARIVIREMADALVLELVEKRLVTEGVSLYVGYDSENLKNRDLYKGERGRDYYGREVPKHTGGTVRFDRRTSSTKEIVGAVMRICDSVIDPSLTVRRINVTATGLFPEGEREVDVYRDQIDIFSSSAESIKRKEGERVKKTREKSLQHAMIDIKQRFGKNAIIKAMSLEDGATAISRNSQIGGHRA